MDIYTHLSKACYKGISHTQVIEYDPYQTHEIDYDQIVFTSIYD